MITKLSKLNKFILSCNSTHLKGFIAVAASWDLQPKDVKIAKGKRLAINCSAFGFPRPKVKWSLLTRFGQEKFISYDNLIVDSVDEQHKGKYKCEASNGIGSAISKIISINIFGKIYKNNHSIFSFCQILGLKCATPT